MNTFHLSKRARTSLQRIAERDLENIPMTFTTADLSPGRKVFFPVPLKQRPDCDADFLYIYVESRLTGAPKDTNVGFTQDDVIDETGVYQFQKNSPRPTGATIPLEALLTDVISDLSLRNRILHRVDEMKHIVHLDDDFLDAASDEWRNRSSNNSFGFKTLH